ncbi:MAG: acetyl-CoA carboxylase biotin carboxylase subunit, partial [Pseudomonadota bacterium]
EKVKSALHQAAVDLVASVKYRNAGTVEFLYDLDREEFYFIEVNARIQVEHPVSEIVTGEDLVQWQLRIAGGEPLSLNQSDLAISGHAIECRINAEDPHKDFHPQPGQLTSWHLEHGSAVRLDSHCRPGAMVPPYYDSMLGKLIVHGSTRTEAAALMGSCLADFTIKGITTNRDFQRFIVQHPDFIANRFNTKWLEQHGLPAFLNDGRPADGPH